MNDEISRRNFLKLSGVTAFGIAAVLSGATSVTFAPEVAEAKEYGASASKCIKSKFLLNARIQEWKYNGKTVSCKDTQALAVDHVNKRYYMTKTAPNSSSRVFIFSAPMSATKLEDWQLVKCFDKSWLKHGNGMCCQPCGKGTKLFVATDTKNLRVIYIPDASKPGSNLKTSTWVLNGFKFRGVDYDPSTNRFLARNGISKKNGNAYFKCITFKAPTSETSGTHTVSVLSKFHLEVPSGVIAPKGIFNSSKAVKINPRNYARQDFAYGDNRCFVPMSDTKGNKYKSNGGSNVARNVMLSWTTGDPKAIWRAYSANNNKAITYPLDKAIFDSDIPTGKQGYEMEGVSIVGDKLYLLTNEASKHLANKQDSVRVMNI